jgi:hypothetical protein
MIRDALKAEKVSMIPVDRPGGSKRKECPANTDYLRETLQAPQT